MTPEVQHGLALGRLIHALGLTADIRRSTTMSTVSDDAVTDLAALQTDRTEALAERLFGATISFLEIATIHLGRKLGYYGELAEHGPATPGELARRTGTAPRYAREWLEQQATAGFLAVDDPGVPADERVYRMPEEYRAVLVDAENLNLVAPLATLAVGVLRPLDAVVGAYRNGTGVPFPAYGEDVVEGIASINRPQFVNEMAGWLGALPDVDQRLRRQPPARVADIACGSAWSSIAIARAYPDVVVDALDVDEASIEVARANVAAAGLTHQVHPAVTDASAGQWPGRYDLVTIFEALHDMNHPVEALRTARASLADGGCVVVADERVAEAFAPDGDELERFNYCWSVLHCLPVGLLEPGSAGTGTVMRPDTVRRYAREAGFAGVEVLPIDNVFWRFYVLRP